jgi:hypothetical protein
MSDQVFPVFWKEWVSEEPFKDTLKREILFRLKSEGVWGWIHEDSKALDL